MPRHVRLFCVLVLFLGFTCSAWGQNFGNVRYIRRQPERFRQRGANAGATGRHQLHHQSRSGLVRDRRATFGASGTHSLAGGPHYAWAGACVNPASFCPQVPTVTQQVGQYLSSREGRADPDALYAIWGGLNDVSEALEKDSSNAQAHTVAAADVNVEQVRRLREAGARHILVYNLPDISKSPYAINYAAVFPNPTRTTLLATFSRFGRRL